MIKSKLDDGVDEVELDMTTPEDLVGCSYSLPITDYVKCSKCNQIVPNTTEDEYEEYGEYEWDEEFGRTDSWGDYTGRKEFTCPNCGKSSRWNPDGYDDEPFETIYTDDLQDIPNIDDIVPHYMEVYNAVYKIYEENGEDDWAKAFDIYMQQKGGNDKVEENKEIKTESKTSLQEATIKALYDGLKDDEEVNDVEGIIDDVLVVTDPEITTDEYNEVIERAEEIIEDTPEGDIPLDPTYLGEYLQTCPICGGSFVEDHILEPGTACPICYETPESFVMVGKLQAEDSVAEDNGLVDDTEPNLELDEVPLEELGNEEPNEKPNEDVNVENTVEPETTPEEVPEETNRPRGARLRRNREVASKEIPTGNRLTENKLEENDEDDIEDYDVEKDDSVMKTYKVSFYVDSTETPKDEIKNKLNDALAGTGLASIKDDIEIELYDTLEEDNKIGQNRIMTITDGTNKTEFNYDGLDFGIGDYYYNGNETGAQIGFYWDEDRDMTFVEHLFLTVYVGDDEENDLETLDETLENLTPDEAFKVTLSKEDYQTFLKWKEMCDVDTFTYWDSLFEDKEKQDDKELLLGDEQNDEPKQDDKEFQLVEADEEKIKDLENNSAFTWEGMAISDDNLQAIVDDLKVETKIKLPVIFYTWKGKLFNEMYGLTDKNAYDDDLNFLSIDLDNWSEMGRLPFYKMQVGARWLDDIVDNNKVRQDKIDGIENEE